MTSLTDVMGEIVNSSQAEIIHDNDLFEKAFRRLHDFQQNGELCDVVVNVDDSTATTDGCDGDGDVWTTRCHRVVLSCYSDYFRAMFCSDMKESKDGVVNLHDVDKMAVESLIKFCYTTNITLTIDNVQSVLHAASILQMQQVANYCTAFIRNHINSSNCLHVRDFSITHGQKELVSISDDYARQHYSEISRLDEFLSIAFDQIKEYIKSPDLNVESEKEVYDSVIRWTKHDLQERIHHLSDLLNYVKMPLLSINDIMCCVDNEQLLKFDLRCRDYVDEAKTYQLQQIAKLAHTNSANNNNERTKPRLSYAGMLLCAGGRSSAGEPISDVECYDITSDEWFRVANMSTNRRHVGLTSTPDGKIFAAGGYAKNSHLSSVEYYNPFLNAWTKISSLSKPRRGLGLVYFGGTIYAIGGLTDNICFNIVERYDPEVDEWINVASMITPRGGVSVAALHEHIYAVGGNDGIISVDSCERYDPILNKWTTIDSMSKRRAGAGLSVLNGRLYVAGGFDGKIALNGAECFDPTKKKWSKIRNMLTKRGGVGLATLAGRLYAVGGHDGQNFLNTMEVYDPEKDEWSLAESMDLKRAGAGLTWFPHSATKLKKLARTNECRSLEENI
ncbi:KLHL8 (predicted) [Pycnogonum litorale]